MIKTKFSIANNLYTTNLSLLSLASKMCNYFRDFFKEGSLIYWEVYLKSQRLNLIASVLILYTAPTRVNKGQDR